MAFVFNDSDVEDDTNHQIIATNSNNNNSQHPSLEQLLQNDNTDIQKQQTGIFFHQEEEEDPKINSLQNKNVTHHQRSNPTTDEEELLFWRRPASPSLASFENDNNNNVRKSESQVFTMTDAANNNQTTKNGVSPASPRKSPLVGRRTSISPSSSTNQKQVPQSLSPASLILKKNKNSAGRTTTANQNNNGETKNDNLPEAATTTILLSPPSQPETPSNTTQQNESQNRNTITNDDISPASRGSQQTAPVQKEQTMLGEQAENNSELPSPTFDFPPASFTTTGTDRNQEQNKNNNNFNLASKLGLPPLGISSSNSNNNNNNNNISPPKHQQQQQRSPKANSSFSNEKLLHPTPLQDMDDDTLLGMTVLSRIVERFRFYEEIEPKLDDVLTFDSFCWLLSLDPEARVDSEINSVSTSGWSFVDGGIPSSSAASPSNNSTTAAAATSSATTTIDQNQPSESSPTSAATGRNPQAAAATTSSASDDLRHNVSVEMKQMDNQEFLFTTEGGADAALFSENFQLIAHQYQSLVIRLWDNVNRTVSIKTSFRHLLTFNSPHFPFTLKIERDALRALAITSARAASVVSVRDAALALQKANEEYSAKNHQPQSPLLSATSSQPPPLPPGTMNNGSFFVSNEPATAPLPAPAAVSVSNRPPTSSSSIPNHNNNANSSFLMTNQNSRLSSSSSGLLNERRHSSLLTQPASTSGHQQNLTNQFFFGNTTTASTSGSQMNNNSMLLTNIMNQNQGGGGASFNNNFSLRLPTTPRTNSAATIQSVSGSPQHQQQQKPSIEQIRDSDPILRCIFGPLRELPVFVFSSMVDAIGQHADNAVFAKDCAETVLQSKSNLSMLIPVVVVFIISLFVVPMMEVPELFQVQRAGYSAATADWQDFCPVGEGPTSPDCKMFRRRLQDVKHNSDILTMFRSFVVDQLWPASYNFHTGHSQEHLSAADVPYKRSYVLVGAVLMKSSPLLLDEARAAREALGQDPNIECPLRKCETFNLTQPFFEFNVDAFFSCDAFDSPPPYVPYRIIPFGVNRKVARNLSQAYVADLCEESDAVTTLQFAMYAPTAETLSWVTIAVAVPKAGSAIPEAFVQTMNLKARFPVMVLAITQILAMLWLTFFTIRSYRQHIGWFKTILTFNNVVQTVLTAVICTSWGYLEQLPTVDQLLPQTVQTEYIPHFDGLLQNYNVAMDLCATWVVCFFISSVRLFADFVGLDKITRLLKISAADLLGLLVIFSMILIGFIASSRVLFGLSESKFAFTSTASVSILGMFWGRSNYKNLTTEYPIIGSIFFFLLLSYISLLLLNLLIAVITATVGEVSGIESLTAKLFEKIEADTSNFKKSDNPKWFWFQKSLFPGVNVMLDALLAHTSRWDDLKEMLTVLYVRPDCQPPLMYDDDIVADGSDEFSTSPERSISSSVTPTHTATPGAPTKVAAKNRIEFAPLSPADRRKKQQRKLRSLMLTGAKLIAFCCPHKTSDNNHPDAAKMTAVANLAHLQHDNDNDVDDDNNSDPNSAPLLPTNKNISPNESHPPLSSEFSHRHFVPLGVASDNGNNIFAGFSHDRDDEDTHQHANANKKDHLLPPKKDPASWNSVLKRAADRYRAFPDRIQDLFITRTIVGITSSNFFRDATYVRVLEAQTIITNEINEVLGLQKKQSLLCAKRNEDSAASRTDQLLTGKNNSASNTNNNGRSGGLLPRQETVSMPSFFGPMVTSTSYSSGANNNNSNNNNNATNHHSDGSGTTSPAPERTNRRSRGNSTIVKTAKTAPSKKKVKRDVKAGMCTFLFNQFIIRDVKSHSLLPVICIIVLILYLVFIISIFNHRESATWLAHNLKLLFKETPWQTHCDDDNCTSGLMHKRTFSEVRSLDTFETYLQRLVIPNLFPAQLNFPVPGKFQREHADGLNGFPNGTFAVAWDEYLRRTSPITIRQLRTLPRACASPTVDEEGRPLGGARKGMFDQIKCYRDNNDGYDSSPIPKPNLTGSTKYTRDLLGDDAYVFQDGCAQQRRILGSDGWIPCYGHTATIHNKSQLDFLLDTQWLGPATKLVIFSTSLKSTYTDSNPLFTGRWLHYRVEIFLELPVGGGVGSSFIYTTPLSGEHLLYDWYSPVGYIMLVIEVMYYFGRLAAYLFVSYTIHKKNKENKASELDAEVESVRADHIRPVIPGTGFFCLVWIIIAAIFPELTVVERKSQYMAALIVNITAMFIKYFLFPVAKLISHRAVYLDRCLHRSVTAVVIVVPYFITLLVGFTYGSYVAFGRNVRDYSTLINAATSIVRGTLSDVQFEEMYSQRPVLAVAFTGFFVAIVVVILGTVLTALMKWSTIEAKLENAAVTFIRKSAEYSRAPLYADEGVAFYLSWSIVGNMWQRFTSTVYKKIRDTWKEYKKKGKEEAEKKKNTTDGEQNNNHGDKDKKSSTNDKRPTALNASVLSSSKAKMKSATRKVMTTMKWANAGRKRRQLLNEHDEEIRPRHFFITPQGRFARPAEVLHFVLPVYQLNELATALKIHHVSEYFLLSIALYVARLQVQFKLKFAHHFTLDTMLESEMSAELREQEALEMQKAIAQMEQDEIEAMDKSVVVDWAGQNNTTMIFGSGTNHNNNQSTTTGSNLATTSVVESLPPSAGVSGYL